MFDDTPLDCHRHCEHWDTDGECCECGEEKYPQEPIPVKEFFSSNPGEDDHSVSVNELGWPISMGE